MIDEVRDLVKIERTAGEHQQADCDTDQPVGTGMHRLAEREIFLVLIKRQIVERFRQRVAVREQTDILRAAAQEQRGGHHPEEQRDETEGEPPITPVAGGGDDQRDIDGEEPHADALRHRDNADHQRAAANEPIADHDEANVARGGHRESSTDAKKEVELPQRVQPGERAKRYRHHQSRAGHHPATAPAVDHPPDQWRCDGGGEAADGDGGGDRGTRPVKLRFQRRHEHAQDRVKENDGREAR